MLRRIKGVTLREKVKSVDTRKEMRVNGMDTCREWEENNETSAVAC